VAAAELLELLRLASIEHDRRESGAVQKAIGSVIPSAGPGKKLRRSRSGRFGMIRSAAL
jgi:hypothetical protein